MGLWNIRLGILISIVSLGCCASIFNASHSFTIDYVNDVFLLDGEPFQYVSGSLHYFRVPRVYWRDRLRKFRAAGLNAVSTYVEWSQHQPSPTRFDFSGDLDIAHFIQLAQEEDLLVLLRPGPYICAEREMGGFPPWLLTLNPDIKLRTNDTSYTRYAELYLNTLLSMLQPLLYGNGGPIIMVQVENEYGSYGACDGNYLAWLRDVFKRWVGDAALLYTTDGNDVGYLRCGKIEGVYATVDFGAGGNVTKSFEAQRAYEPHGPFVNSEFYPGWLTHWGESFQRVATQPIVQTLDEMLALGASVNFYMFFGGTNFDFLAGANFGDTYLPQITSYDYDAPLTEAGDPTDKYFAIRDVIAKYLPMPNLSVPSVAPKGNYGKVVLEPVASILDHDVRRALAKLPVSSAFPLTFEQLGQRYGFVLYETYVQHRTGDPSILSIPSLSDRAIVMVDGESKGILSRMEKITSMPLEVQQGQYLQILVENQGRINYGSKINDFKGLVSNATLDSEVLRDWKMTGFPLRDVSKIWNITARSNFSSTSPAFYRGSFSITQDLKDTFLNSSGWGKGVAYVNGHNLGRYWPLLGPQVTLYVPGSYLKPHPELNELVVFELEQAPSSLEMDFVPDPVLDLQAHPIVTEM